MLKLLIAGEELTHRKGLNNLICQWFKDEIQIVGIISDIMELFDYLMDKKPDIILICIEKPCNNELEVIRKIKYLLPDVHTIMQTTTEFYELAEQTILIEIDDYIKKPYEERKYIATINKAILKQNEKKKRNDEFKNIKSQLELYSDLIERETILRICSGEVDSKLLEMYQKLLEIRDSNFFCMVIKGLYSNQCSGDTLKSLKSHLKHFSDQVVGYCTLGTINVFIFYEDKKFIEKCPQIRKDMIDFFRWKYKINIAMEISKPYNDISKLGDSLKEAGSKLNTTTKKNENIILEKEELLIKTILKGDKEKVESIYLELCLVIREYSNENIQFFKDYMKQLYFRIIRSTGNYFNNHTCTEELTRAMDNINEMMDFYSTMKYVFALILESTVKVEFKLVSGNQKIEKIKLYVQQHYCEKLTLEELAELIQVSETHLSKMFKKVEGITLKNYITEVKMNKSMEFFKDENLSVSEVAYKLGYTEPNYFSRVFKKYTGVSPKQYINCC